MTNEMAIAEKLLHIGAVKLSVDSPFTWASGWKSPIYCDNRKLLSHSFERDFVKSELCSVIFEKFPEADGIAGVATAGIAWGAMVADQLKMPMVYVRSKPKEHGLGNQIEGDASQMKRVVVLEDLVSTGKSSLQVCQALTSAGLVVDGLVSIFNYGFDLARTAFEDADIRSVSLSNYPTLVQLAFEKKIVDAAAMELLLAWRKDPATWSK